MADNLEQWHERILVTSLSASLGPAFQDSLTRSIRQAVQPKYLTKAGLCELTGWSSRQVEYKKQRREIPFVQHGRSVLFPTDVVYAFLEKGYVPARPSRPANK